MLMELNTDTTFEGKLTCAFKNEMRNYSKFSPEHVWNSKNWKFDGIVLSKVENIWTENLQGSFVSWQWRRIPNLNRNWLVSSKLTWRIWRILTRALENLKNLTFNGLLLSKVYNVWPKKVQGIMFGSIEYWCNIWRKTDMCFQKWHEEFRKFSPEHVRKPKNWNFDGVLLFKVENVWA